MKNKLLQILGIAASQSEYLLEPQLDTFLVSQMIGGAIKCKKPLLVSRLGFTEARCVSKQEHIENPSDYILKIISEYSGVFPSTKKMFQIFAKEYLNALTEADLLGLIRTHAETLLVEKYTKQVTTCDMGSLEPFLSPTPWSKYLEGKRVVVVHPFAESIVSQYEKHREGLFLDKNVLPEFQLLVVKTPQTYHGDADGFQSWFEVLNYLISEIEKKEFDVAVLGCGAYGLPLGAHIKRAGKVAIHLGGATQLLFGISGKRWRDQARFRAIMTDAWRPPLESERPPGWELIDGGCYW